MARRGWVSAEVAQDTWRRLVAFDDGWVELPGLARALSDTRRNLRDSLMVLGVFIGALALGSALDVIGAPAALVMACAVVALGALVYGATQGGRARRRGVVQASDDSVQTRAETARGQRLQVSEGAPRWRRATSAAELAGWLDGAVLVAADDVLGVETDEQRASHLRYRAQVRLGDGSTRTYASPDKTLPRLLAAYGNNPAGR